MPARIGGPRSDYDVKLLDAVTRQVKALAVLFDEHGIALLEESRRSVAYYRGN
jgi:hypothetical protein